MLENYHDSINKWEGIYSIIDKKGCPTGSVLAWWDATCWCKCGFCGEFQFFDEDTGLSWIMVDILTLIS